MNICENSKLLESDSVALETLQLTSEAADFNNIEELNFFKSLIPDIRTDGLEYLAVVQKNRDTLLDASDWIVVKSLEAGVSVPSNWVTYRQALRDVPAQSGYPDSITWPIKPE